MLQSGAWAVEDALAVAPQLRWLWPHRGRVGCGPTALKGGVGPLTERGVAKKGPLAERGVAKKPPFFFQHDFTCVLNPSFFWGVQMEFSIQNEINSFHLFCNTIRLL